MIGLIGATLSIGFLQPFTNSTVPDIFPWSVIAVARKPSSRAFLVYAVGEGKASCTEK